MKKADILRQIANALAAAIEKGVIKDNDITHIMDSMMDKLIADNFQLELDLVSAGLIGGPVENISYDYDKFDVYINSQQKNGMHKKIFFRTNDINPAARVVWNAYVS